MTSFSMAIEDPHVLVTCRSCRKVVLARLPKLDTVDGCPFCRASLHIHARLPRVNHGSETARATMTDLMQTAVEGVLGSNSPGV
jgi:hypothetical protein